MDADDSENTVTRVNETVPGVSGYDYGVTGSGLEGVITDREAASSLGDDDGEVGVPMLDVGTRWIRRILADDDRDNAEPVLRPIQQAQSCATLERVRLHISAANDIRVWADCDHLCAAEGCLALRLAKA